MKTANRATLCLRGGLSAFLLCSCGKPAGGSDAGPMPSVIKQVFEILIENEGTSAVYANSAAPYLNSLMGSYAYSTNYVTEVDPSEPNYIWLEAGGNNCGDHNFLTDSDPSAANSTNTTDHLVTYLSHAGVAWKAYAESDTNAGACPITTSADSTGSYAPKHVPFVFFQDLSGSPPSSNNSTCASHVVNFEANFANDLSSGSLPPYVFITPNLCHDGHNTCPPISNSVGQVDDWLKNTPSIQSLITHVVNPANHAILILNWDESQAPSTHPEILVAPPSTLKSPGSANSTELSHSSTVKSLQEIFGVDPSHNDPTTGKPFAWLRHAGDTSTNDFSSFFATGQFP